MEEAVEVLKVFAGGILFNTNIYLNSGNLVSLKVWVFWLERIERECRDVP
jgi:hypothetical protein